MSSEKPARRRHSWLITLSVVGGAIGFLLLVFFPGARSLSVLRAEIRERQDYIGAAGRLTPIIGELERDLERTRAYNAQWSANLREPSQLSEIFGAMTQAAEGAGLATKRFEPQSAAVLETLEEVPTTFIVSGEFASACKLIAQLEQLPQLMWINELRFTTPEEAGQVAQCELKLGLFTRATKKSD